ncbi:hypothetical protein C7374_105156 [Falsochrobactrum ovis]|uniref:Uncharacterized protein n=1 Tax=Falsochrobactrum ovis TaxID=1293442 RepID=A0A364JVF8_9HYPH|nr:hypothetical protein C7374_105156 [Falsochrobactrum ovis]
MIDAFSNPYFGFIGILTSAVGSVIVLSLLVMWATEQVINLFGLKKALIIAYRQHLISKKGHQP